MHVLFSIPLSVLPSATGHSHPPHHGTYVHRSHRSGTVYRCPVRVQRLSSPIASSEIPSMRSRSKPFRCSIGARTPSMCVAVQLLASPPWLSPHSPIMRRSAPFRCRPSTLRTAAAASEVKYAIATLTLHSLACLHWGTEHPPRAIPQAGSGLGSDGFRPQGCRPRKPPPARAMRNAACIMRTR
jgi:hypothetical protein